MANEFDINRVPKDIRKEYSGQPTPLAIYSAILQYIATYKYAEMDASIPEEQKARMEEIFPGIKEKFDQSPKNPPYLK